MHQTPNPGPVDRNAVTSHHVRLAVRGDHASLEWVVRRFTPPLLAMARYRMGPRLARAAEPEDVVAEVWAIALPRLIGLARRSGRQTPVLFKFLSTTLVHRISKAHRETPGTARQPGHWRRLARRRIPGGNHEHDPAHDAPRCDLGGRLPDRRAGASRSGDPAPPRGGAKTPRRCGKAPRDLRRCRERSLPSGTPPDSQPNPRFCIPRSLTLDVGAASACLPPHRQNLTAGLQLVLPLSRAATTKTASVGACCPLWTTWRLSPALT